MRFHESKTESGQKTSKNLFLWGVLLILIVFATVLRVISCYWGTPLEFHIDEQFILFPALKLIENKTYICRLYMRPDQVEIKLIALVLKAASNILWGSDPNVVFDTHSVAIYVMSRFVISAFGILMVPVSAITAGHLGEKLGFKKTPAMLIAAAYLTFSPILIKHSGYITPDVPLTCVFLLFGFFFIRYLEQGKIRDLVLCSVVSGIGTMIKYPSGILFLMIAFMVIFRAIREKKYRDILLQGLLSAGVAFLTMLLIMPNLIEDLPKIIESFLTEAGDAHLEAPNKGYWGNLLFYCQTVVSDSGYLSLLPFGFGLYTVLRNRKRCSLFFLIGPVFVLCMAAIPLTWERWTLPIFPYYHIMVTIGILSMTRFFSDKMKFFSVLTYVIAVLTVLNILLSGIAMGKHLSLPDSCTYARAELDLTDINSYNTFSQYRTPFSTWYGREQISKFDVSPEGTASIHDEFSAYRYFAYSDYFLEYYRLAPEKYDAELKVYEAIDNTFPKVYELYPDGNYEQKPFLICNIPYTIQYLLSSDTHITGYHVCIVSL